MVMEKIVPFYIIASRSCHVWGFSSQRGVKTKQVRERGIQLHGTLRKSWRGKKSLQLHRESLKIAIKVLPKDCEHWPGGSYTRSRQDGANSLKLMLMAFLPRASGEEAVIESNKSQPLYTRRGEQAGLLAMEPGNRGGRKPSEM